MSEAATLSTQANSSARPDLPLVGGFCFRLFDQHHRDAVDYWIQDLALRTAEAVRLFELHLGVTFRAGEDLEKFLGDHERMVVRLAP